LLCGRQQRLCGAVPRNRSAGNASGCNFGIVFRCILSRVTIAKYSVVIHVQDGQVFRIGDDFGKRRCRCVVSSSTLLQIFMGFR
jgi:hypothetical protein